MKNWKKTGVILICAILILIGGILFIFFQPFLISEPSALLEIERGVVEVKKGDAWEPIANNTNLKEGWSIKTSPESEAEIVFFGGSVARLNENSEIKLKEIDEKEKIAYLEQKQGDIWCNVLDAGGISFLVETSEGIFTNEGCIFRVTTTPTEGVIAAGIAAKTASLTQVSVTSGFIRMNGKSTAELLGSTSKQLLKGKAKATINSIKIDKKSNILPPDMTATIKQNKTLTFAPIVLDKWVEKNKAKDNIFVVKRREQFKKKYQYHILVAKSAFPQLTDELLNSYLDDILWGKINVNQEIQKGSISQEYIRFIPSELINTKTIPPSTKTEDVKTSISEVWPAQLGISSPLPSEERLVSTGEDPEMREVDLHISGKNFATISQVLFFPGEGMGVSHVSVFDSENILATIHIEKNAIQTGPKAILLFDKNNPTAQAKLNSAVNVQASLSKEEELRLDGWILRNKLRKYQGYKSAGRGEEATVWMLSIMRELDVLPPARGAGPCDEDENRILFGLKQAIMAGVEDIAQSPIPTDTLTVLLEMYNTLANFFNPRTAAGKTTLTNKLQNRGFTLEESQDILDEIGGIYNRLGPLLR